MMLMILRNFDEDVVDDDVDDDVEEIEIVLFNYGAFVDIFISSSVSIMESFFLVVVVRKLFVVKKEIGRRNLVRISFLI